MPPNDGEVRYRFAAASDAAAIAELHAESWRYAYRGMFPDDFLDNDVFEERADAWQERFADPGLKTQTITVLAESDSGLAGFAHSIIDEDETYGTLLDNLHVRNDAHQLGIGTRLMAETAVALERSGNMSAIYLWVLEDNARARSFYKALGGEPCGRGTSAESNPTLPAVPSLRVCWPKLSRLSQYLRDTQDD